MSDKRCPSCHISWEREETITETFIKKYTDEGIPEYIKKTGITDVVMAATSTASSYGCRVGNPRHFGANVVGIETDDYDGISWWHCTNCGIAHHRLDPTRVTTEFDKDISEVEHKLDD